MRAYLRWWRSLTDLDWWAIGASAATCGSVIHAAGLTVVGVLVWVAGLIAAGWGGAGVLLGLLARLRNRLDALRGDR